MSMSVQGIRNVSDPRRATPTPSEIHNDQLDIAFFSSPRFFSSTYGLWTHCHLTGGLFR